MANAGGIVDIDIVSKLVDVLVLMHLVYHYQFIGWIPDPLRILGRRSCCENNRWPQGPCNMTKYKVVPRDRTAEIISRAPSFEHV